MEPFPPQTAVEWEFRCHGKLGSDLPWGWSCRAKDGTLIARSQASFRTLRDAVADAGANGFQSAAVEPVPGARRGGTRSKTSR
jgi:hypothetical protein